MGQDAKPAYDVISSNSQIVTADEDLSYQAGVVHCEMRRTKKTSGSPMRIFWQPPEN